MKRAILGAAAGSISGALIGGVLGRVAMLILRLTSPDSLNGVMTDDEFEIGTFTLSGSLNLLVASAFFGSVIGLFVVLSRAFIEAPWWSPAWGVAGATVIGALVISDDGVDFTLLEPLWLAIAMFVMLPAAATLLMAFLIERFEPWWWKRGGRTVAVGAAALPVLAFFPVAIVVALIGAGWAALSRREGIRRLPDTLLMQRIAVAVFGLVVAVSGWMLALDVQAVL